jgi:glycosyltransferase involved in cell wall biosynthesis
MRILHIIDKLSMDGTNPSSCTILFGGWARSMAGPECQFEVLSLAQDQQIGDYLRERGIKDFYVSSPRYSPKIIGEICKLIAERNIDIVHLHGYGAAHFGRIAARRSRVKNVVHEHAALKVKPQHYFLDWLLREKTDIAVAVSESVREFMINGRNIPADRIRVIGNGVDLARFPEKTPAAIREARGLIDVGPDIPLIGTVTRFREEKGNEFLIAALEHVRSRFNDARLVVIGDGELRESLHRLASERNIGDAVHWLGFRSDLEKLMPAFDVHVIPSLTEGFPLALAEGMAVGNAMVVTEVGGMKEIGSDRENLLFVPSRDSAAIAEACVSLLENRQFAQKLARNARRSAESMSIDQCAKRIVNVYRELMSGSVDGSGS